MPWCRQYLSPVTLRHRGSPSEEDRSQVRMAWPMHEGLGAAEALKESPQT